VRKKDLGRLGERIALDFLKKKGFQILKENYTTPFGEIDIIASDGQTLSFIEVKSRTSLSFGLPEEGIDSKKIKHLSKASLFYIKRNSPEEINFRFDVVTIFLTPSGEPKEVRIIKDAFPLSKPYR